LFVKLNAALWIVTLALSGAPMDTVGVGGVFVPPVPEGVLFAVELFAGPALRDVPPPPPLEQAAKATRQTEDARRIAPFRTVSMKFPQIIVLVQGHGNFTNTQA